MNILEKTKETTLSVLPVMAIVTVLGLVAVPRGAAEPLWLGRFLIAGLLLIAGLSVFLLGVDLGIEPMGGRCGAALTARRSLPLLLGAAFAIGLVVTAAEPDIQVFSDQVRGVFSAVNKTALTAAIAGGVALFLTLGIARTVLRMPVKTALLVAYALAGALALVARREFVGIAFDAGGATTGPMTVPFLMALGLGVSSVRPDGEGGFGLTGIASVGPVLAVLAYSLLLPAAGAGNTAADAGAAEGAIVGFFAPLAAAFPHAAREATASMLPLFGLFAVFQTTLLRMTARQCVRMAIGFTYALAGLTVFLTGVNGGFMQAGRIVGETLGHHALTQGGAWTVLLVATGLILGAIIVCAEPAVWVLSEQVERASGGTIRRRALLAFLSGGTALAIALAVGRALLGFPLGWLLAPGYVLALALMAWCPATFTGIAFDSGGVASGPLTSTFVLSFTLGAASSGAGAADSFGVIALVAMMPLVAIQLMGILYARQKRKALR